MSHTLRIVIVIQEGPSVPRSARGGHEVIVVVIIIHDGFLHWRPRVTHALVQHPVIILIKQVIIVIFFFSCSGLNISRKKTWYIHLHKGAVVLCSTTR